MAPKKAAAPSQTEQVQRDLEIAFAPKGHITCIKYAKDEKTSKQSSSLIFTHGASGTLKADAMANFAEGFATTAPMLSFQGSMNLNSRVKMFEAVCEDQKAFKCLGGRSMGARAAIMAATDENTHLALVSYPLHNNKATRDQILLDLPADKKVIFVSGNHDNMCDLKKLEDVRSKMKCKTWLCVVEGADHGMKTKPAKASKAIVLKTGEIVARWLEDSEKFPISSTISWNDETSAVELNAPGSEDTPAAEKDAPKASRGKRKAPQEETVTKPSGRKRRK